MIAATELVAVEVLANLVGEDEVVGTGEVLAAREAVEGASGLVDERDAPDPVRLRAVLMPLDVAPTDVE